MPEPPQLPPIREAPLSLLLTVRDAQPVLDDLLEKWSRHLDKLERDYEIVLVDDGSVDQTAARAEAATTQYPRLRVLRHEAALGVGVALKTGLAAVRHPLVCWCEPGYQPADLKLLLERIDKVHLVTGVRTVQGKPLRPPRWCRLLLRFVFGVHVTDADCAFKLFRREICARIPIQSKGAFAHAELLAKANFLGCVLDEVPVTYRPGTATAREPIRRDAHRLFSFPDFGPPPAVEEAVQPPPARELPSPSTAGNSDPAGTEPHP